MFNLIPISLLITAIGGMVYIVSNHLSEFSDKDKDIEENSDSFQFNLKTRFAQWAKELPLDNIKSQSLSLTQKMLHKFRLTLLKTDNHLMKLIDKISQQDKTENGKNNDSGNAPDFWEDFSKNQEQKQVILPPAESEVRIDLAIKNETAKNFFDIKKPVKKRQRSSVAEQLHGKE